MHTVLHVQGRLPLAVTAEQQKLQLPTVATEAVSPAQRPALPGQVPAQVQAPVPGSGPSTRTLTLKASKEGRPAGQPHGAARRGRLLSGRCGYVLRPAEAKGTPRGLASGERASATEAALGNQASCHGWPSSRRWAARPARVSGPRGWYSVIRAGSSKSRASQKACHPVPGRCTAGLVIPVMRQVCISDPPILRALLILGSWGGRCSGQR